MCETEKIIGGLRIGKNNCGLDSDDLTILNIALSTSLPFDNRKIHMDRIEEIWTRINLLNDFWNKQHGNNEHGF